jgi:hypothetical protein
MRVAFLPTNVFHYDPGNGMHKLSLGAVGTANETLPPLANSRINRPDRLQRKLANERIYQH